MSFVVIGRPPGTITYQRRPRCRRFTNGVRCDVDMRTRSKTVTRRHRLVICHAVPYATASAAQELLQRLLALGWQDLEVYRCTGSTSVRGTRIPANLANAA